MVFPAEQQRLLPAHHMETVDFLHAQQAAEIWGQHVTFLPDRRLFSSPFTLSEQDVARWTHLGMGCTSPT